MTNTALQTSSFVWSLHELQDCQFNDERLTQRGVKIAATMLCNPNESIPNACENWADTKATYRFFNNPKVRKDSILAAHFAQTSTRCESEEIVLVLQDTTTLNLSNKQIKGIGRIGMGDLQGFFVHSGLAVSTKGTPLGLVAQKSYVRKDNTSDPERIKRRKRIPIEEKETIRWIETIEQAKQILSKKRIVVIGDRESDIFEVFQEAKELEVDVLIRTAWNRRDKDDEYLIDKAQQGEILCRYEAEIPLEDSHLTRKAVLTIRKTSFAMIPPRNRKEKAEPVRLTILNVEEENPGQGIEEVHWVLTTSLTVETAAEAKEKVQWYIYRWRIERFHFILKTGALNVEDLQFEDFKRWDKVIALFSVVAWRILWTVYETRANPEGSALKVFSQAEVKLLSQIGKEEARTYTLKQATMQVAKLGGFLGRKSDGVPGIKTLWRGFQKLPYILYGYSLANSKK